MKLLFTIALLLVPFASPFHLPPVHGKCPPTTRRMSSPLSSNELIKQQLTQKQKQYEAARKSVTMASNTAALPTLESLKMLPYLCPETGLINPDCYPTSSAIRASVYGIFDASYGLQFIGMSRNIKLSLRMHLGRKPDATYGIVVYHVQKPSRTLLESIKEQWIEEVGTALDEDVAGWESALDVKAVMNEKDRQMMTDAENKVVRSEPSVHSVGVCTAWVCVQRACVYSVCVRTACAFEKSEPMPRTTLQRDRVYTACVVLREHRPTGSHASQTLQSSLANHRTGEELRGGAAD